MTLVLIATSFSQELTVKSFQMEPTDLSASTHRRNDFNNEACALVKVQLARAGATFEGNVVGDTPYSQSEYWVYMTRGTKMLQVKLDGFLPFKFNFPSPLEGLRTYTLTIVLPNYLVSQPTSNNISTSAQAQSYKTCPDDHHPHMIDLGLPSGTKWACCNVGARKPEEYGEYYAWGEIEKKEEYSWSTYKHCDGTRYTCHDIGNDIAGTEYDVARVKMGEKWRMPTYDQFRELLDNCKFKWTKKDGKKGIEITGSNGGKLFLPAAGISTGSTTSYEEQWGPYLSSSLDTFFEREAIHLNTNKHGWTIEQTDRCKGLVVRAVTFLSQTNSTSITHSQEDLVSSETFSVNGVTFKMVRVEAGTFTMGATPEMKESYGWVVPTHQVTLTNAYYLGRTEVTQELWKAVMGNNPSYYKSDYLPVEQVSWEDCQKFIDRLNALTGREFRLPTEAEWEYAARGANRSQKYTFSGSNNIDEVAWYEGNSGGKTHEVASKCANELGLYDMCGNVHEWCLDWFGVYNGSPQTNPEGPANGTYRVYRGGSWGNGILSCRSSDRSRDVPEFNVWFLGLRLALSDTATLSGSLTAKAVTSASANTTASSANMVASPSIASSNVQSYKACSDDHHPHMIDLGLPSWTKWACCNVGATKPEEYGGYYAWGETEVQSNNWYDLSSYRHCDGSRENFHDIGKDISGTQYDVAHVKMGGAWRMPTYSQIKELRDNCKRSWITRNGVNGLLVTGTNGKAVFIPAAGYRNGFELIHKGTNGFYWSSSLGTGLDGGAQILYFQPHGLDWSYYYRSYGQSVRAVCP